MLEKCNAILLNAIKYGDSSLILKTYTLEQGLMSFIVSKSKRGPLKAGMTLPLTQLRLVYYSRGKGSLKRIKEGEYLHAYTKLGTHPVKNCVGLFLAELLSHVLHEEEGNPALFQFISQSLLALDKEDKVSNLHLNFMLSLTAYLGFAPSWDSETTAYFDLIDGTAIQQEPLHAHFIGGQVWKDWKDLEQASLEQCGEIPLSSHRRNALLDALLLYYRYHVKDFGTLKSVDVIQSVLH